MTQTPEATATVAPAAPPRAGAILRGLGRLTLLAILVQFILAGLGTFDTVHGGTFQDSYFSAHNALGFVIAGLTLVILLAAFVARPGRTTLGESILLFVLAGPIQPILGMTGANHAAWVGSLHVLNGLLILALTARIAVPGAGPGPRPKG
jgi:hypothetical protein